MVLSDAFRRLASFARPRRGFSILREGLEVRLALMSVAQPSRDDAADDTAGLGSVGEDDGERNPLRQSDGDDPSLSVVPAVVFALQRGTLENERRELEVEAAIPQVSGHSSSDPTRSAWEYAFVYTSVNRNRRPEIRKPLRLASNLHVNAELRRRRRLYALLRREGPFCTMDCGYRERKERILSPREQVFDAYSDVPGDLSQEDRRDVAALVERNGREAAVRMLECLWEPRCRTSSKPSARRSATTSRGFKTGSFATIREWRSAAYRRTRIRVVRRPLR